MFCRNCGSEIPEGAKVCGYCGTPVNEGTQTDRMGASPNQGNGNPGQSVYGEAAPGYGYPPNGGGNGYPNPGGYGPPNRMDGGATGMAVTSMVLGILALVLSCRVSWWLTLVLSVASIVLGALALSGRTTGRGMAIAGIVCSAVALVIMLFVVMIGATLFTALFSAFGYGY